MKNQFEKAEAARHYIASQLGDLEPLAGIITGTGIGALWEDMEIVVEIPYHDIPHFPVNTVQTHAGIMYICRVDKVAVIICAGRFHYYEGHEAQKLGFPVRVMYALGIRNLLVSNAAGGVHANYLAGDIVGIRDHINLQPEHVLRGFNDQRWGERFPDMMHTYASEILNYLRDSAKQNSIRFHQGVYLALQGPSLETPAEYEMVHRLGADLVGMSTVPEVLVARHMNMQVTALSVVSNVCYPIEALSETSLEEVVQTVQQAFPSLKLLVNKWVDYLQISNNTN